MRYLASRQNALRPLAGGVLLAEDEFTSDPIHIAIVGAKQDGVAGELFRTAVRFPSTYIRTEWLDWSEGAPARNDVQYPKLSRAAAFLCAARSCSKPLFTREALEARILAANAGFPQ
jgi:hypothetical protein